MEALFILYWIIAGFACLLLPSDKPMPPGAGVFVFLICMLIGGIIVPARLLAKAIR